MIRRLTASLTLLAFAALAIAFQADHPRHVPPSYSFRQDRQEILKCKPPNFVLAPGGEEMNGRVPGFGNYGFGLNRDVYGTSFSTAVASAVACILMEYGWFSKLNIAI